MAFRSAATAVIGLAGMEFVGAAARMALFACDPAQVLCWFVQRWQAEVTFREVCDHFGVETQRQWSDLAIARTTPCLLGLFSLVALLGKQLTPYVHRTTVASAWYRKQRPTFSDSLAGVRRGMRLIPGGK